MGGSFHRNLHKLPEILKSPAIELRNALKDEVITNFEIWYVHNLPESTNCRKELEIVEHTAISSLKTKYRSKEINVKAIEVGKGTLGEWYKMTQTPIIVNDEIEFSIPGGFEIHGDDWNAITTAIKISDLNLLFKKYDKKIFSANIRDYLGTRKSDSNINHGIKETAIKEPQKFCVYNNGITVITHDYDHDEKQEKLKVTGISIVNGAQTTGSIGTIEELSPDHSYVSARFIKCTNPNTILNIVKYNNSQNKITATDFRSNDPIQDRLRKEFTDIGKHIYLGGRRGGAEDAIKRQSNLLPSESVAQALAAFHGYPNIAYNQKSDIWNKDDIYSKFFNESITAVHILFTYSLFTAIKEMKIRLFKKQKDEEEMLATEKSKLEFLRLRGANYIYISAIASCIESIINKSVSNLFRLSFTTIDNLSDASANWQKIIDITIPFSNALVEPTEKSLKITADNESAIKQFRSLVEATLSANKAIYEDFAEKVKIN
jgi:hypothetical protein